MDYETIKIDREDAIVIVTINRPKALNALNSTVLSELKSAFDGIAKDKTVRAVIITGEGDRAFIAGADIKEMLDMSPMESHAFMELGHSTLNAIEALHVPVIAAVNGFALGGGCELALACDMILASEKAKLGLPEVGLGLFPGFGGTQRLARLVGRNWAKQLILSGEMINAAQAKDIGLVNEVLPPDELMTRAKTLAEKIASNGPLAVRFAKQAINCGLETDLVTGLALEIETETVVFASEDRFEGMLAFTEKRKPNFQCK